MILLGIVVLLSLFVAAYKFGTSSTEYTVSILGIAVFSVVVILLLPQQEGSENYLPILAIYATVFIFLVALGIAFVGWVMRMLFK